MVPESAKDPSLPPRRPPFAGALGAEDSHIWSGVTAQAVYSSNPALPCSPAFLLLPCSRARVLSVILEVPTPSPFCRPQTLISTVTASSPWLHTHSWPRLCGSAYASTTAPSEGTSCHLSSPGPSASHAGAGGGTNPRPAAPCLQALVRSLLAPPHRPLPSTRALLRARRDEARTSSDWRRREADGRGG